MISIALIFFLVLGAVSATELVNVSNTEDSNLVSGNDSSLSVENKLEISSEDSISETNIVNSHDDDLNNCPSNDVLKTSYEDDGGKVQASNVDNDSTVLAASENNVVSVSSSNDKLAANTTTKVSTSLSVANTHYDKSATYFKVTLKDKDGKAVTNQKVSLKVNGKSYSANTDKSGIALIKTASLKVGSYTLAIAYSGNSNYSASSLSKKVKVLSSLSGSDMTKYYGYTSQYKVTLWKDNNLLTKTKVSIKVNGKTYTRTTDSKGVATLNVGLAPGKYVVTTTNPYSGEKLSNNIVVKKDSITITPANAKTYILYKNKYSYTVTVKSKHDVVIKNTKVSFTYNGKTVTAKTNANGKATITIPVLAKGTYSITYKTGASKYYNAASSSGKIYVVSPTTKLSSSTLKMTYNDGSKFSVKLTDTNNKVLANKSIKFTLNSKTYTEKTNSKGIAYLKVGNLKPATYTVKYQYGEVNSKNYNYGTNKIVIAKQTAKLTAGDLTMKYKDGSVYKATVKDKSGNPLKNVNVKFTINGKTYTEKTDSNGVAKLNIGLAVGYYPVKSVLSNTYYQSSTISKHVLVDGTKFIGEDIYVTTGSKATYSVKAVDGKSNPIKNTKIVFTVGDKTYSDKTDSKGVAQVSLGVLSKGDHTIKYSQGSYSGSSKIHVVNTVSIKQLIASSKNVKTYIEKNKKLPSTVKIGDVSYSLADYLYLASKAVVNLKAGKTSKIAAKDIDSPSSPAKTYSSGNLNDYLAVAKSVVKTADSKGKMPNSVSSKVGKIGYDGVVYAASRVVAFYGDNGRLPYYVTIKATAQTSSSSSSLNSKNTIKDLTAYLAASANCQVNNAKIKKLVEKLTKGLKTDKAKANAIFEYVRDTISYSFYYNTKYGAVGTLNAKSGNCVDHSHLLAAMYRTAGLATRYAHGTCTFSSGSTYGHVWTQVLIGNTWTVSDATSSRNSLGKVVNWNTNSYKLNGYYSSISF